MDDAPIVDLDVGDGGIRGTLSFRGLPSRTFVPWSAVRRLVTSGVAIPAGTVQRCALCARSRTDVRLLLAGDAGCICDSCTALAVGALETQSPDPAGFPHVQAAIAQVLTALPPFTPFRTSAPLLRGARVIADGDAAVLRSLVPLARQLWQDTIALELDALLPPSSRTFGDRIVRAVTLLRLGRHAEAATELATIDEATLADHDRVVLWVDRASASAGLAAPALDDADRAIAAADALIAKLAQIPAHARVVALRSPLACSRIRVALARGKPELAATYGEPLDPDDAECTLTRGDVEAALGHRDAAVTHWQRALSLAHPESVLAAGLRQRL